MSHDDSEQSSVASNHEVGGYQSERQQQQVVVNIDDNDESMMDIDEEEEHRGTPSLQSAVNYFQLGSYQSAVGSFESWRKHLSNSDDLAALSAAADQALCRFRVKTNNVEFYIEVLYREAILANNKYTQRIRALGRKDLIEAAMLASISAIWIHTKMNKLQMARHTAWDVLQWAVATASTAVVEACTIEQALVILSLTLSQRSLALRKFRHVLTVLDLIEEKNVSKVLERSDAQKGKTAETRLCDQEEAATMLARHKLGLLSSTATASTNGIACKVSVLLQAVSELREPTDHRSEIFANLVSVSGDCNPSDSNLIACFEAEDKPLAAFNRLLEGSKHLRDDDQDLWNEMAMNMADCLARVGFHDKASDYFMASQSLDPKAAPMQNAVQMGKISPIPDCEVLWRALISSSLNDDPLHILAIADQLAMHNHYEATTMAHSFGLSQAERPSLAKEKLRAGSLSHFVLSDKECLTVPPKEYLQGGVVEACINNNFGVVHAREGNPKAATFLFKKSRPILRAGMPYLHLYYNLTLAYLQMGKKNRAISLWEHVRRLGRTDQRKLRDKLQETAQKLELGLDSKTPPRSTWTGTGIGGLLPSYVHLLDCFVLRYRLQEMEEAALKELADESYM